MIRQTNSSKYKKELYILYFQNIGRVREKVCFHNDPLHLLKHGINLYLQTPVNRWKISQKSEFICLHHRHKDGTWISVHKQFWASEGGLNEAIQYIVYRDWYYYNREFEHPLIITISDQAKRKLELAHMA